MRDLLQKFEMADASPQMTPMSTSTALDDDEDGKELIRRESHRTAVKRILRFPEFGLWYSADSSLSVLGFSDSDHAGCRLDRKSTSGTCQFLGTSLVSLSSCKQSSVATSTCEADAISVAKNLVLHSRTKHIDVRYHFLRDNYEKGIIDIVKVASENQVVGEGVDKPLIKGEIEGLKCTESSLSS
ncbi:hypothetical protein U9M48_028000 [Paspalum notatum var. saurae]|uniref:Uncharacterized protein n=1 Tax=Paspalum notatum var. saurae TaxID=547442 RepID=A0AAQ3X116_PASNO